MADGTGPVKLLPQRLNWVRLRNGVKLKWVSVAEMLKLERSIWETCFLLWSQTMAVQLQRLLRLVRDHEVREGGAEAKVFFQVSKASACVFGDEMALNGSKASRKI